jgi:hypothetical protein
VAPPKKWQAIEGIMQRNPALSLDDGDLIVAASFLEQAYADVRNSLDDLIGRIKARR